MPFSWHRFLLRFLNDLPQLVPGRANALLEWGGYRLGRPPDPGVCPPNTGCAPIGPPLVYTNDGFVYTPAH